MACSKSSIRNFVIVHSSLVGTVFDVSVWYTTVGAENRPLEIGTGYNSLIDNFINIVREGYRLFKITKWL